MGFLDVVIYIYTDHKVCFVHFAQRLEIVRPLELFWGEFCTIFPIVLISCIVFEMSFPNRNFSGFVEQLHAYLKSAVRYGRRASLRQYDSSLQIDPKRDITSMRRVGMALCSNGFVLSRDKSKSFNYVTIAPNATTRVSCIATRARSTPFASGFKVFQICSFTGGQKI